MLALRVSPGVWVLPEEYMCPSSASTHCLVIQWIQVQASVLEALWDEISHYFYVTVAFFARFALGNLDFPRTPRYLARTSSLPVAPEEHRKIGISGSRLAYFFNPSYLAVTC